MSNGAPHDHPGEYRVLGVPATAAEIQSLAEAQETEGYLLAAMNQTYCVFYKSTKPSKKK